MADALRDGATSMCRTGRLERVEEPLTWRGASVKGFVKETSKVSASGMGERFDGADTEKREKRGSEGRGTEVTGRSASSAGPGKAIVEGVSEEIERRCGASVCEIDERRLPSSSTEASASSRKPLHTEPRLMLAASVTSSCSSKYTARRLPLSSLSGRGE